MLGSMLAHLRYLQLGLHLAAGKTEDGFGLVGLVAAEQPAWRFLDEKGANGVEDARDRGHQEHPAPGDVVGGKDLGNVAGGGGNLLVVQSGKISADQAGNDNPKRQHELEDRGAPATDAGRQAFSHVQRHDDADDAAGKPHEDAAGKERSKSLGSENQENAGDKHQAAGNHHQLATKPIGKNASHQGGAHAAQGINRDDER